jgi:ankyrin repeat protein
MNNSSSMVTAVRAGEADRVRALLSHDATLASATDEHGVSAIMLALYHRQSETLQILLSAKPELNVFEAAGAGHTARLTQLLDEDPALITTHSADGFTALHLACFFARESASILLVDRGSDVAAVSKNAMKVMPLHSAVTNKNIAIMRALLEHGAPVNARQQQGWTPLHEAAQNGDPATVKLLLHHGADRVLANDDGTTALDLAKKRGNSEVVRLLE